MWVREDRLATVLEARRWAWLFQTQLEAADSFSEDDDNYPGGDDLEFEDAREIQEPIPFGEFAPF